MNVDSRFFPGKEEHAELTVACNCWSHLRTLPEYVFQQPPQALALQQQKGVCDKWIPLSADPDKRLAFNKESQTLFKRVHAYFGRFNLDICRGCPDRS